MYVANNPLIFIDPDGRDFFRHDESGAILWLNRADEAYTSRDGTVYTNIGDTHQFEVDGRSWTLDPSGGVDMSTTAPTGAGIFVGYSYTNNTIGNRGDFPAFVAAFYELNFFDEL